MRERERERERERMIHLFERRDQKYGFVMRIRKTVGYSSPLVMMMLRLIPMVAGCLKAEGLPRCP